MDRDSHTDDQIRQILSLKKVAVVGMSQNPGKAAHGVPRYLSENGYDITPVNPNADEILGKKCFDEISQVVLSLIGVRENVFLGDENKSAHGQSQRQYRNRNLVDTHTTGLEGQDLVCLVQESKGHQCGDQHGDGDQKHQNVRKEIEKVIQK